MIVLTFTDNVKCKIGKQKAEYRSEHVHGSNDESRLKWKGNFTTICEAKWNEAPVYQADEAEGDYKQYRTII